MGSPPDMLQGTVGRYWKIHNRTISEKHKQISPRGLGKRTRQPIRSIGWLWDAGGTANKIGRLSRPLPQTLTTDSTSVVRYYRSAGACSCRDILVAEYRSASLRRTTFALASRRRGISCAAYAAPRTQRFFCLC